MTDQRPGGWGASQPAGLAPLDQPQYDATFGQAVTRFWRKFVTFSGRASRSEYWWWVLASFGVSLVLQIIGYVAAGPRLLEAIRRGSFDFGVLLPALIPSLVWAVIVLLPTLAVVVRRLHDSNRRGWWCLLYLPTYAGLPFQLRGLASFDPQRLAEGDTSGLALIPMAIGGVLSTVGSIGAIVVLIFLVMGPDPRGARFDRT